MSQIVGHISQVIGPVVDVYFEGKDIDTDLLLPSIHDALTIKRPDGRTLVVEVQQHIGEDTVRTVAMDSTDGLQRGMEVIPTGHPITMPVGNQIKGRLMNVVGDAVDGMKPLSKEGAYPIHREPPKFEDLSTTQEVLFTGIKVIVKQQLKTTHSTVIQFLACYELPFVEPHAVIKHHLYIGDDQRF